VQTLQILIIFITSFLFFSGCSGKNSQLFSNNVKTKHSFNQNFISKDYKIKPSDRLSIVFFEYPELSTKSKDSATLDVGIEVSSAGTITMPIIGKILVAGKSKEKLQDILYKKYSLYLEKPALRVDVLNQKVYVLGEVKNPGAIELSKQRTLTPIMAISLVGGLSDFASRDTIKVVRGGKNNYQILHIDLTDMSSINRANINLLPDDIVYVAHNRVKDFNLPLSGANPSLGWINTLFSTFALYQAYTRN